MTSMCSEESEFGPETRSYPWKNKAKEDRFSLFLCTEPGAQMPCAVRCSSWSIYVLLRWEEVGREDIYHSLSEMLSAFITP